MLLSVRITHSRPGGYAVKLAEIKKDKRVTGLNGVYAAGSVPLLLLFAVDGEATLLRNAGLILALIGIGIDFSTARHLRRLKEGQEGDEALKARERRLHRRRRTRLIAFRAATLSIAIVCGLAYAFGQAFIVWLHGAA